MTYDSWKLASPDDLYRFDYEPEAEDEAPEPKPRIITEHVYPPIPWRQFDWCAYRDGYEPPDVNGEGGGGYVGWGPTEEAAIADLLGNEEDE